MAETLTFGNYNIAERGTRDLYEIGDGVVPEMAAAFGHELTPEPDVENLGELVALTGPNRHLQENSADVQARLQQGVGDKDAVKVAAGWIKRSGMMKSVERPFMQPGDIPDVVDVALITGGVRNWMQRRSGLLMESYVETRKVVLAAAEVPMSTSQGPDVVEGMTQAHYMEYVVAPQIEKSGRSVELVRVEGNASGSDVMSAAARSALGGSVLLACNAGNWVQTGAQFSAAAREQDPSFDGLYIMSDQFEVGETGNEPTATHQNPITGLGALAREFRSLAVAAA